MNSLCSPGRLGSALALGVSLINPGHPAQAADLPPNIEELLTDQGTLKFDTSLTYANSNRSGVSLGTPVAVQIGTGQFVTLPSSVGQSQTNRDTYIAGLGLRYGLARTVEVYGRGTWLSDHLRIQEGSQYSSTRHSGFNDAWLGVNYRIADDSRNRWGAIGFGELALAEESSGSTAVGKSQSLGLTLYRTLDPIVLAASGVYRHGSGRSVAGQRVVPGSLWALNPQLSFAVNDQVTLTGGMSWQSLGAKRVDGQTTGLRNTSSSLHLGAAFLWSKQTTLVISTRSEVSGLGGTNINLSMQTRLGQTPGP